MKFKIDKNLDWKLQFSLRLPFPKNREIGRNYTIDMNQIGIGIIIGMLIMLVAFTPSANAQIEPFELQLQQIRDPQECTRKLVQGSAAEIPFTLKVFYDTTSDRKISHKQQGNSFPITQQTNQVMIFHTNSTDQYQISMEMNYQVSKLRQVYIEYLSGGVIQYSEQEKFDGNKFCMTIIANTKLPDKIPTREELFGDVYYSLGQIPSMVEAFNRNTLTTSASISFMWILILGNLVLGVFVLINSFIGKRKFDAEIADMKDIKETAEDSMEGFTKTLDDFKIKLDEIEMPNTDEIVEVTHDDKTFAESVTKMSKEKAAKLFTSLKSINIKDPKLEIIKNIMKKKKTDEKNNEPDSDDTDEDIMVCGGCDGDVHCDGEIEGCQCECTEESTDDKSDEEIPIVELVKDVLSHLDVNADIADLEEFEDKDLHDTYSYLHEKKTNPVTAYETKVIKMLSEEMNERTRKYKEENKVIETEEKSDETEEKQE